MVAEADLDGPEGANDNVKAGTAGAAWAGGEEPRWLYLLAMVSALPFKYDGISGTSRRPSRGGGAAFWAADCLLTDTSAPDCSSIASRPGSMGKACGAEGTDGPLATDSFECRASNLDDGRSLLARSTSRSRSTQSGLLSSSRRSNGRLSSLRSASRGSRTASRLHRCAAGGGGDRSRRNKSRSSKCRRPPRPPLNES